MMGKHNSLSLQDGAMPPRATVVLPVARPCLRASGLLVATAACVTLIACSSASRDAVVPRVDESPYLLISAADEDSASSDFLAVIDVRPGSSQIGNVVGTAPTGMKSSLPHHMEYSLPPAGELLFMNAHHHEISLFVDVSNPRAPRVAKTFMPPAPLRFPHDYYRTPTGTRLVG